MTNAAVERSDSQRSQANGGGPRVSFNRDVHVKRIGARQPFTDYSQPNHQSNNTHKPTQSTTAPLRRELPKGFSADEIRREAALVLAQAAQVDCHVDSTSNDIVGGRMNVKNRGPIERKQDLTPDRFHSLPSRKKHTTQKPVGRSSSDASTKAKSKRPSIFNIFKKSTSTEQLHPSHTQETQWKKVSRSRSDVGSAPRREVTAGGIRKRNNSETDETLVSKKKSVPLSPIIESPSRQSYFDTEGDLDEAPPGNIGFTNQSDLDLVPSKPPATKPVDTTKTSPATNGMHSSQQPVDRLPLTKGVTVDGLAKNLAMDRFSPVPHLHGTAFSYTRPNTFNQNNNNTEPKIVYAQLDGETHRGAAPHRYSLHSNGITKSTIPETVPQTRLRSSLSPPRTWQIEEEEVDYPRYGKHKSVEEEAPIVPIIREVRFPIENSHHHFPKNDNQVLNSLSNRRKLLESRINSRKVGSTEHIPVSRVITTTVHRHESPVRTDSNRLRSKSMGREKSPSPIKDLHYNRHESAKYSPRHTYRSKSYDIDREPVDDSYDEHDSPFEGGQFTSTPKHTPRSPHIIDLGYIEDMGNTDPEDHYDQQRKYRERYRQEFEPKSLDSQFSDIVVSPKTIVSSNTNHREFQYPEQVHTMRRSLSRPRSLERGDSGIERDYRKGSGGGKEEVVRSRWRSTTSLLSDAKNQTEQFLKRERLHSERLQTNRYSHMFRERSIDDGSHFDPRLDKYPVATSTMTRTLHRSTPSRTTDLNGNHTVRNEKKLGLGLDKVKQLFTSKKKHSTVQPPAPEHRKEKDKYVASEEDVTQRHKPYTGNGLNIVREPKLPDIAMRRRLSTPKASPLPKRTSISSMTTSTMPHKSATKTTNRTKSPEPSAQKKGWYKSLERLTSPSKPKTKPITHVTSTVKDSRSTTHDAFQRAKSQPPLSPPHASILNTKNLRFFGDTDMESNPPTISKSTSTLTRKRTPIRMMNESTTTVSHTHSQTLPRKHGSTLPNHNRESSPARQQPQQLPPKSAKKTFSGSSKHLHNISESASDNDELDHAVRTTRSHHTKSRSRSSPVRREMIGSNSSLQRTSKIREERIDEDMNRPHTSYRGQSSEFHRVRERHSRSPSSMEYRKPPTGTHQQKSSLQRGYHSAQNSIERKHSSRERDSSGTEGDSSQQSQRSIVYLHATTVGAIPQPHVSHTRRAKSREELSSLKSSSIAPSAQSSKKPQPQPMSRTVSRSLSVLAPWTPKHIHEGYEINYSQQNNKKPQPMATRSREHYRAAQAPAVPSSTRTKHNGHSIEHSTGTLPGRFRDRDMRRETVSIPRR